MSAFFDAFGTSIITRFNVETNRAGMRTTDTECSQLLQTSDLSMLGTGPICQWADGSSFNIFLGQDATIAAGNTLTLLPDIIRTADGISGLSPAMSAVLGVPQFAVEPILFVSGPGTIDECAGLVLKGELTSPRPAIFRWSCLNNDDLDEYLRSQHTEEVILLPGTSEMTALDTEYQILCHVTDFLGISTEVLKPVMKKSAPVPTVAMELPIVETRATEMVLLKAVGTEYSLCPVPTGAVAFAWSQTSGPDLDPALLSSSTVPQLLIQPNTLMPGTSYVLALTASMVNDITQKSETYVTIHVSRYAMTQRHACDRDSDGWAVTVQTPVGCSDQPGLVDSGVGCYGHHPRRITVGMLLLSAHHCHLCLL